MNCQLSCVQRFLPHTLHLPVMRLSPFSQPCPPIFYAAYPQPTITHRPPRKACAQQLDEVRNSHL